MKIEFSGSQQMAARPPPVVARPGAADRLTSCAGIGALWGGVLGLLFAPAPLVLTVLGWMEIDGVFAEAFAGSALGAVVVGGLAGLGAALTQCFVTRQAPIKP